MEPASLGPRSISRRQVVVTVGGVMLGIFLGSLDQTIVGTAMPQIISDLGGFAHYTWVTTSYIIASAVVIPITGKLTDMYGRKSFYIAGLAIFTAGSLLSGLSHTMTQIIIFRGIQGVGAGVMMANAFTVIGDLFPPAQRGKYQGLISGVFGLSSVIGPALGGFITDSMSWHWVFFINIPLGAVTIALFIRFFPDVRPDGLGHEVDYPGLMLLVLAVVPAMLALSWGGTRYPWTSAPIVAIFLFSAVMTGLLLQVERHAAEPLLPLSLFRNGIVLLTEVAVFLTAFGMFGSIIFVPLFFQGVLGLSASHSGSFLTPMMLGTVAGSFLSGQLLSRAGGHYRVQGAVSLAITAGGIWLVARMTTETSYSAAVINIVLTGFGLGMTMPLYTIIVQNAVPHKVLGVATSSVAFSRSMGGSVGLAVFGSAMSARYSSAFWAGLSPATLRLVPAERLGALADNPQALLSSEAQAQLAAGLESLGTGWDAVLHDLLVAARQALAAAISDVFLIALAAVLAALVVHFFIMEVPLRKTHTLD